MAFVNILSLPGLTISIIDRITLAPSDKVTYDATDFYTTGTFRDDGTQSDILVLFSSPALYTDPERVTNNISIEGISGSFPNQSDAFPWGGFRGIFCYSRTDAPDPQTYPFLCYGDVWNQAPGWSGGPGPFTGFRDLSGLSSPPFGLRFYKNAANYNPDGAMSLRMRLLVEVDTPPAPPSSFWTGFVGCTELIEE